MKNTRLTKVLALVLVFVMMMSSVASAAPGRVISNTLNATFYVEDSTTATVTNQDTLEGALADELVETIILGNDITLNKALQIKKNVTINGGNNTITNGGNLQNFFSIPSGNVTIKNLKLVEANNTTVQWALNVSTNITVDNVEFNDVYGGMYLNTVDKVYNITNSKFNNNEAGIGVGTNIPLSALADTVKLNTFSGYVYQGIGWDGDITEEVDAINTLTTNNTFTDGGPGSVEIGGVQLALVNNQAKLSNALSNSSIKHIVLTDNFSVNSTMIINRDVTINGGYYTITNEGNLNYFFNITSGDNVIIKDLSLDEVVNTKVNWALNVASTNITVDNVEFNNVYGGMYLNTAGNTYNISNSTFNNNAAGIGVATEINLGDLENIKDNDFIDFEWQGIGYEGTIVETHREALIVGNYFETTFVKAVFVGPYSDSEPVTLSWTIDEGVDNTFNVELNEEKTAVVEAVLKSGAQSFNARLVIEVAKEGISGGDFEFVSVTPGEEGTTGDQNAGWLNRTVVDEEDVLTFYWGPTEGTSTSEIANNSPTTAKFKFNKEGTYTINIYLIEVE